MFGSKTISSTFLDITLFIHSLGYHSIKITFRSIFLLEVYENPYIKRRAISSLCYFLYSFELLLHWKKMNILTTSNLSFLKLLSLNYSYVKWWSNSYIFLLTLVVAQREWKDIWEEYFLFIWIFGCFNASLSFKEKDVKSCINN